MAPLVNPFRTFRNARRPIRSSRTSRSASPASAHYLDIYRPADGTDGSAPVLLQVHGGAWILGNKDQQGIPLMQHLAAKGWVCVAINYRLSPRDPCPAQVVDVKQAIALDPRAHRRRTAATPTTSGSPAARPAAT